MARGRVGIDGQLPLVGQVYIRHHMTQATHTLAFQAAINALPAAGGEIILDDMNYTPVVASLTAGARTIRWTGNGTVNGAAFWGLPGQQVSFRTALGREIRYQANGAAGEFAMFDWRRNANYTGGLGGSLDYILRLQSIIGANVGSVGERKAEKAIAAIVTNNSTYANGVAGFFVGFAETTAPIWALESSVHSKVTPVIYAHRSAELNMHCYGPDPNDRRWVLNVATHRAEGSGYSGTPGTDYATSIIDVYPDSADGSYGLRLRELPGAGTSNGVFLNAALYIDKIYAGDMVQMIHQTAPALIKYGSHLNGAGNTIAQLIGQGKNSAGAIKNYTSLRSLIVDPNSGTEDGRFDFYTLIAGTEALVATIGGQTRLFNLPIYANEAAADAAGLVAGTLYMTAAGEVRIKL